MKKRKEFYEIFFAFLLQNLKKADALKSKKKSFLNLIPILRDSKVGSRIIIS